MLTLLEINRVLVPGGTLLISTPEASMDRLLDNPYHISIMTREEFRRLLASLFRLTGEYFQSPLPPTVQASLRRQYRHRALKRWLPLDVPIRMYRAMARSSVPAPVIVSDQTYRSETLPDDPYAVRPVDALLPGHVPYISVFQCVKVA